MTLAAGFPVDTFCFNLLRLRVSLSYSICSSLQSCTTLDRNAFEVLSSRFPPL